MRRLRLLPLIVIALWGSGCAGSKITLGPDRFADAERQWTGRPLTLVLYDGSTTPADALRLDADSASWVDPRTGEMHHVPTSTIVWVRERNRLRGTARVARWGAIGGAVFGAAAGGFLGYGFGCCTTTEVIGSATYGVFGGATLGALYGAAGGGVVGLVSDPVNYYRLDVPRPPPTPAPQ